MSYDINKQHTQPLYQQLSQQMEQDIHNGILKPETRLPAIRTLAEQLHVNTSTVIHAYKELEQKRLVYTRMGSGVYVSPVPVSEIPSPVVQKNITPFDQPQLPPNAILFTHTSPPNTLFPVSAFQSAFDEVLTKEQGGAFEYTDSMGYLPLREQLCTYLHSFGIQTDTSQMQIISGAQQGIDLISKAMLRYGDIVFVEQPTFYGAVGAFLSRGATVLPVPLQKDGLDMIALENYLKLYHPKFIYMMAYFQTPTGISYSLDKKRKLLELSEQYDTYIIEEDDFYDFHYGKEPIVPLKALDYKNRVIYIKSFSKIWMPGLRMGVMVLPKKIRAQVLEAKYTTDISTSGLIQKTLLSYLQTYGFTQHANKVRYHCSNNYQTAIKMAKKYLYPHCHMIVPQGGVSIWLTVPEYSSAETLYQRALQKNVLIATGNQFSLDGKDDRHIRLSFASLTPDQIEVGMKRLGDCLDI